MDNEADLFLLDANIEVSARQKIIDAIGNVVRLGMPKSTEVQRFDAHRLTSRAHDAVNTDR